MRNNKTISKEENVMIIYQILSTHSLQKRMEISLENLYVDIGAYRVNNDGADHNDGYNTVKPLSRQTPL